MENKLVRGQQILYVPRHLQEDTAKALLDSNWKDFFNYPSGVQPGFVTSGPAHNGGYFCRYWYLDNGKITPELRTKANSELTPEDCIVVFDSVPQQWVNLAIEDYC